MNLNRRSFLIGGASTGLLLGLAPLLAPLARTAQAASAEKFEVMHTDAEWRKLLSPGAYNVLRQEGTEYPYSSPLNSEHRAGIFSCAGSILPSIPPKPSSRAIPAGPVSGSLWIMR